MAGTLWEWCLDPFETSQNRVGSWLGHIMSKQSIDADRYVLRGGSWLADINLARSDVRYWYNPSSRYVSIGFRVVCSSPSSDTLVR